MNAIVKCMIHLTAKWNWNYLKPTENNMKNKTFLFYKNAALYFNTVSQNYVAYFIYNREDETYEVINQDRYDHYTNEFDLDMELLEFYC